MGNCTGYAEFREDSGDYYHPYRFEAHCDLDAGHDGDHIYRLTGKDGRGRTLKHVTIQWEESGEYPEMKIDRERIVNAITGTGLAIEWKHQKLENLSDEELIELVLEMLTQNVRNTYKRLFG